jgi:protein SCO1/2
MATIPAGRRWLVLGLAWLCLPAAWAQGLYDLDIPFVDDRGQPVRLAQWRGREAIITMEYSSCRFMCSATLYELKLAQAAADRIHKTLDFIVISLDPRNDTPAAWAAYRRERGLSRNNWHFLTGPEGSAARLARLLGINYWYEGEHLLHDFRLLRTRADGQVVRTVSAYDADVSAILD